MNEKEYIVDITKPPIGPPLRIFNTFWFVEWESKESIDNTRRYLQYLKVYQEASDE